MVHEDTNKPMTPEQVGEYVCNSVKKSAAESGRLDFLFISAEKPDGPADVCHVGNGPTSPANALLIAAAPDLLAACKAALAWCGLDGDGISEPTRSELVSAIAKAEGVQS